MAKDLISIIVPCYNEEETIHLFIDEVKKQKKVMPSVEFEIIFVNDGSKDRTLDVIKEASENDSDVHYLSFSRNFGKESAMYAGMEHSNGDYVVIMDVDLQDPPSLLNDMYQLITTEDYDSIGTKRADRKGEPVLRSFFSRLFYITINKISDTKIVDGARDYRMMTRQMVDSILEVSEYNRFSKGIFGWVGYKTKYLEYDNVERAAGKTSWSFWGLLKYSFDGIVTFSEAPLAIASLVGLFTFIIAILMAVFFFIRTIIFGNVTSGWTSLVVILLGMGGLQLLCLGIVGKYIGKIFLEVKHRPIYVLKEKDEDL